jgi:hypothetical protein
MSTLLNPNCNPIAMGKQHKNPIINCIAAPNVTPLKDRALFKQK